MRVPPDSCSPLSERLAAVAALLPEAVADGELDAASLAALLGQGHEGFGLRWVGEAEAFVAARRPTEATLQQLEGDAPDVVIEGDNLEVLKVLQRAYAGRFQLIFVDPPYNTGRDFVYPDDYRDPLAGYLAVTEGRSTEAASGRLHSRWLSMMAPRLVLARSLLRPDGFFVATIDDHEQATLQLLLDRVFGEENRVAGVAWQKAYSPRMDAEGFSRSHDWVLVYRRSEAARVRPESFEQDARQFTHEEGGRPYRRRSLRKEGSNSLRSDAPGGWYPLSAPDGTEVLPYKPPRKGRRTEGTWRMSHATYAQWVAQGLVEWVQTPHGWQPYKKQFLEARASRPPTTWWTAEEAGHNHAAATEVQQRVGPRVFDTPKPLALLRKVLALTTDPDALVLDFFAGSGTTGEAVALANAQDGGARRFVLVQLPLPIEHERFATLADVLVARLQAAGVPVRRLALAPSGLSPWRERPMTEAELEEVVGEQADRRRHRRPQDWALELQLKLGLPLHEERRREAGLLWVGEVAIAPGEVGDAEVAAAIAGGAAALACLDEAWAGDEALAAGRERLRAAGVSLRLL